MKRLILFLCLIMFGVANADFLGVKKATETISFFIKEPIDSAYGIPRLPDSVHIFTYSDNATTASFATRSTTYPFSDVSIDTLKRYGDTTYVFADQIQDIDGIGGNFELAILIRMFTNGYYLETHNTVQIVSDSLENFLDASKDSSASAAVLSKNNLDSLQAQDGWVAKEASLFDPATDSVIVDVSAAMAGLLIRMADSIWLSSLEARDGVAGSFGDSAQGWGATAASALDSTILSNILHRIVWGTAVGSGSDSSSSAQRDVGAINSGAISSGSFVAGAINANAIDAAAINASEFGVTAATKIADAVNDSVWRANFETYDDVAGSFGDSAQGWGATAASALDSTILSNILHRIVWGTAVGSGSDSSTAAQRDIGLLADAIYAYIADSVWDEILSGATHNIATSAGRRLRQLETGQVLLTGTINTANDSTATLGLSGDYPDDFFLHNWLVVEVGPESVQVRQINGYTGATDSVDMAEAEAWVIVPANGDTWEIVANTGVHVVDLHPPVVLQIIAAMYDKGIWIDDNSGNTNTEPGIDGTRANPVSTFAAARTLADALGYQKYYLVNNTILTLAATHEDWEFIGVGEGNLIDFGSQDVDGSIFEHLMISGTQGGTGVAGLHECYLNTIDSLEAIVIASSFSDTISVRVSGNTVFDQCYSNVAGNNTPGLDFNSAGTINVSVRHYSGGLALFNGTSTHTISYESDGQLVIDASCTSINVTARGNMTITDNGTTTALTVDAVYNKGFVADTTLNTAEKDSILAALFDKANATSSAALPFVTRMLLGWPDASPGWDTLSGNVMDDLQTLTLTQERMGLMVIPHIGTVNDAAPTSSQFIVSASIAAYGDDFFNDLYLTFITGNLLGRTKRITDFETTNDTIFTISFFSAPANGDSFVVSPGNFDLARDSLFYQGAAGSVWAEAEKDSILAALFDKGSAVSGGAIPFLTRMILGFPNTSPGWDSLTNSITSMIGLFTGATGEAGNIKNALDSLGLHVGQDGASTSRVSLHMKVGSYSGAAGDDNNIKDDIDAIAGAGGSGAYSCSLFAWDGASAITSGSIRMISGVNEYVLPIDANGWVEFSLDGGTWSAYATALRFIQDTIPQTITFSTHHVDTISMTAFSPSTPTDTGKVVLYVWTDRILGDTLEGATFRVIPLDRGKNWVTGGNRMVLTGEVTKKTNSNGYAEIEVYQSSYTHPYPSGSDSLKYNISITYPGLSSWSQFRFAAPDTGNQYQIGVIE